MNFEMLTKSYCNLLVALEAAQGKTAENVYRPPNFNAPQTRMVAWQKAGR
jgi:hypothetical protein